MSAGAARRRLYKKLLNNTFEERSFRAHIKNKKAPKIKLKPYESVNKKKKKKMKK